MASPMGKHLYESLGYKVVSTEKVQVEGEEEAVLVYAMEKRV